MNEGDKDKPHDEATDMGSRRDAASGRRVHEITNSLKNLNQEPETDEDNSGQLKEERQKQNRHDDYDAREWKQTDVTAKHARDRAGCAEYRNCRCRIKATWASEAAIPQQK